MYSLYAADNLIDTKVQKTQKITKKNHPTLQGLKLNLEASNDLFSKLAVRHALTRLHILPASASPAYSSRRLLPGTSNIPDRFDSPPAPTCSGKEASPATFITNSDNNSTSVVSG